MESRPLKKNANIWIKEGKIELIVRRYGYKVGDLYSTSQFINSLSSKKVNF